MRRSGMSMLWMLRAAALAVALAAATGPVAGCFETPLPACSFLCGNGDECPDGYRCAPDKFCKREDVDPAFRCPGTPAEDASPPDSQPAADADTSVVDASTLM